MRTNEEILNEIHSVKNHKKTTQHIYKHSIKSKKQKKKKNRVYDGNIVH